jgi:hypothetical protein
MRTLSSIERLGNEKKKRSVKNQLGTGQKFRATFCSQIQTVFFGFIKGTSKNKVTRFFKASASPSASQQKFKFSMVPNKSLTF